MVKTPEIDHPEQLPQEEDEARIKRPVSRGPVKCGVEVILNASMAWTYLVGGDWNMILIFPLGME